MIFGIHAHFRQLTDGEVMCLVKKGRDKAFEELYRRYARRLQGFFFRMLGGDVERAADLTQDLFVRIWTARMDFDGREEVSAWIFTIAYNICRNEYRRRAVQDHFIWQQSGEEEGVEDQIEIKLDAQTFDKALSVVLQQMPPEPRMLFALRFEEDLSLAEIAEIMHLPLGTVKSRCHYLVAKIKQKLQGYEQIK